MHDEASSSQQGRSSSERREATDGPPDAARILRGDSPLRILERLTHGDELGIGPRTLERLGETGYLLDPERLMARVFGRVAHDADMFDGEPFVEWLDERIDKSIRELVREDREEERRGELPDPNDVRYQFLTELLGLESALCRRASIAINDLDEPTRIAFTAVTMRGRTIQQCIDSGLGTLEEVRDRIRNALLTISRAGTDVSLAGMVDSSVIRYLHEILPSAAPPPSLRIVRGPDSALQSAGFYKTAAAKHVVRFQTEELAWWLRMACVVGILTNPWRRVIVRIGADGPRVPTPSEWRSDFLSTFPDLAAESKKGSLLAEIIDLPLNHTVVGRVAVLSDKLVPKDEARTYLGSYLQDMGEDRLAERLYHATLRRRPNEAVRISCLAGLGRIHFDRQIYNEALSLYREAARNNTIFESARFGWLVSSCLSQDLPQALEAARNIESSVSENDPVLDDYLARYSKSIRPEPWADVPPSFMKRLLNSDVGPTTEKLAALVL